VELSGRRYCWCSNECVNEFFLVTDGNAQRRAVYARDRGVCTECGIDCVELAENIENLVRRRHAADTSRRLYTVRAEIYQEHNIPFGRQGCELWDADHIVPLAEGGRDHPDNMRTLCIPCHQAATRALARRLADDRQQRVPLIAHETTKTTKRRESKPRPSRYQRAFFQPIGAKKEVPPLLAAIDEKVRDLTDATPVMRKPSQ
jgi:5-methylcytosine-specific restriction endonuclease McrA